MFFGGFIQLLLTLIFWLVELIHRHYLGETLPTVIPSTWAHAFLLMYTTVPFFIFGFLMTTYPRWMGGEIVPVGRYSRAFLLLFTGSLLYYPALFIHINTLIIAVCLILAGWLSAVYALWQVYAHAPARNKRYEKVLNVALFSAILSIVAYLVWMFTHADFLMLFVLKAGIWLFLMPLLFTVCHRMLPFFSTSSLVNYSVRQPVWSLPVMSILTTGHFILEFSGQYNLLWLVDLPLLVFAVYHAIIWQFWRSVPIKLLAVLHIAFLWFGIAMALYTIQSFMLFVTGELWLGKAPLHALTIGFMTSLLVGMASRVSLGHSGRMLIADTWTWRCFLGISAIAIVRILAEFPSFNQFFAMNVLAAMLWFGVLGAWVWRYLPFTVLPRVDGRLG
jgi:uncharacterized protein involved in response to NO